jgi:hypothetical protein
MLKKLDERISGDKGERKKKEPQEGIDRKRECLENGFVFV